MPMGLIRWLKKWVFHVHVNSKFRQFKSRICIYDSYWASSANHTLDNLTEVDRNWELTLVRHSYNRLIVQNTASSTTQIVWSASVRQSSSLSVSPLCWWHHRRRLKKHNGIFIQCHFIFSINFLFWLPRNYVKSELLLFEIATELQRKHLASSEAVLRIPFEDISEKISLCLYFRRIKM